MAIDSREPESTQARTTSQTTAPSNAVSVSILLALCIPILLFQLGSYGLVSGDEAFYHGVAESMVETGNWFSIDFRGEHRPYDTFMNAPLQYWLRAGLIEAFGSNYWTMRIASASFGLATVLMVYWLVVPIAGRQAALLAGLIQLTTFQFIYLHSARSGVVETALAFLFALTAHLFMAAVRGRRGFIAHHLCIAALLNLKTPVALIPLIAELAYFAIDRDSRRHLAKWLLVGIAVAPVGLAWHLAQAFALDEPVTVVLSRMATQGSGQGGFLAERIENLFFYSRTFLYGTFPYALLYPWAIWMTLRPGESTAGQHAASADWRLFGLFAGSVFVFFLGVGKHSSWYLVPAFPFLSAFLGAGLARAMAAGIGTPERLGLACFAALLIWVNVGIGVINPFDPFIMGPETVARFFSHAGLDAQLGLPVTIGVFAWVVVLLARRKDSARELATALALIAVGYATLRVVVPLAYTNYASPAESIWRDLATSRLMEFRINFPIEVPTGSAISAKTRFYFANDYLIVPRDVNQPAASQGYLLYPKRQVPNHPESDAARADGWKR